jgi:glycosyltransferase involved in cell wall biosynthesis
VEKPEWNKYGVAIAMKICHVSFGHIQHRSPKEWLKTIPYFTSILSEMAISHEVLSFHYAFVDETLVFRNVTYRFLSDFFPEKFLLRKITDSVRSFRPDVIIVHGFHAGISMQQFIRRLKGAMIFVQHHGEKIFRFPKSLLQKRIDLNVTGYFFSSRQMGEKWLSAGLIQNPKKIFEVLEVTSSFPGVGNPIVRKESLNFIWVGRLDANKDPLTLVEGFKSFLKTHPSANLYLIFKTSEMLSKLKERVHGLESNIHLVGQVSHTEMTLWYAKCDFIIATSLFEAGGVSVLEGISCGCIPILSDIPSFRKIISDGQYGILFPQGSAGALTDALTKAAQLDVINERKKILDYFEGNLSAKAIAKQIIDFTTANLQKEQSSALL